MPMFSPSHPGDLIRETIEGLREETGAKFTLEEIATGLGTTRKTLSAIINRRQSVTPEMAIRLAAAFRNTTAEFWLEAQERYLLAEARKRISTAGVRVFWDVAAAA